MAYFQITGFAYFSYVYEKIFLHNLNVEDIQFINLLIPFLVLKWASYRFKGYDGHSVPLWKLRVCSRALLFRDPLVLAYAYPILS